MYNMRLYLSSKRFGSDPTQLRTLISTDKQRVGVILNANDASPVEQQQDRFLRIKDRFADIGYIAEHIDLRKYFGEAKVTEADLEQFGMVWVQGGNIFVLRRAFAQSGFDTCIIKLLNEDKIVYGGESAGAVIAGSSFEGLDIVDDRTLLPDGYVDPCPSRGLGIIDYTIVPHFESDNQESALVGELQLYLEKHNLPHKVLRDGEVIVYAAL